MHSDLKAVLQLEEKLSRVRVVDIQISDTIRNVTARIVTRRHPFPSVLHSLLLTLKHIVLPWRSRTRGDLPRKPIVLSWITASDRFSELVLPVLAQLPAQKVLVIGVEPEMREHLATQVAFATWDDFPVPSRAVWLRTIAHVLPRTIATVAAGSVRRRFGNRPIMCLVPLFLSQALMVLRSSLFLKQVQPRAILSTFDRNIRDATLVCAAKEQGIFSATLMHGIFNHGIGYVPKLADEVWCWGRTQKEEWLNAGTSPYDVHIVGNQRLRPENIGDREAVRRRWLVESTRFVVILSTNPIDISERLKLARKFCEAVYDSTLWLGFVRLHPSESLDVYRVVSEDFPSVRFLENKEMSTIESFALADVVVNHNSGYAHDALIHNVPVVVFDCLSLPLYSTADLVERGVAVKVQTAEELHNFLQTMARDMEKYDELYENMKSYQKAFCASFGDEAASNIAERLLNRARESTESRSVVTTINNETPKERHL